MKIIKKFKKKNFIENSSAEVSDQGDSLRATGLPYTLALSRKVISL